MSKLNRRDFIKRSMVGASYAFMATPALSGISTQIGKTGSKQKSIIKRWLGKTGLELPVVSMGVMRSDNPGLVRAALAAGMIHLDTAHGYQRGKNELMLGEVLKEYPRSSFVIATKIGADGEEDSLEKLDISLQRLCMKYVDILYLHGASSRDDVLSPEMLDTMITAKKTGKVKHLGVSTHRNEPEVIQAAAESGVHEVVLSAINFKQDHYQEVKKAIANAAAAGVGIVGMKTMAGAFHDREKTQPINCKAALKWVLQDENVTTTIPGITSFDQLAENASVNEDLTLTEQEKADLAIGQSKGGLYCQGCERCVSQCRRSLPIPDLMRAYMYSYGYGEPAMGHELLTGLRVRENPCIGCDSCPVNCAKGFAVAEKIRDITRLNTVPAEFLS
jgi:predicted aldo/keto reductase-like oxidoreductase